MSQGRSPEVAKVQSFNINYEATVKLTAAGRVWLKRWVEEQFTRLGGFTSLREALNSTYLEHLREDGTFTIQLYELMYIFGSQCYVGALPMFENNEVYITGV